MIKIFPWLLPLLLTTLAFAQDSLNTTLIGNLNSGRYTNDVWGYTAPDGNEYALVGHGNGVSIVEVRSYTLIEVDFVPAQSTIWRDLKTSGHYAYITADNVSVGLMILDLSPLPDSVRFVGFYRDSFTSAHNLYIEDGYAYVAGSNNAGGADILDLSDPEAPFRAGESRLSYFHDIYVRHDTMFASTGRRSTLAIFDVADKSLPTLLAEIPFPGGSGSGNYSHNSWATEDGRYVMTSTESRGKTVKMWDIRDLDNPVLLDEYLAATSLAHNVHIRGDYAYISHYADGLRIVDIAEPAHVVEVGYYDTNPSNSSNFDGCWGAYPFTNSGYIYASDQEFGLFVIEFNGRRASRIKGRVLDSETGEVIASAHVEVVGGSQVVTSSADGEYKLGFSEPGTYVLRAYRAEYDTTTVTLTLAEGESRVQDFFLSRQPTTSVSGGPPLVPETYRLEQNYPNPFNAGTVIRYGLPAQTHVRLKVYDMLGKEVALLLNKIQPGGQHQVRWDGRNNAGQDVPSAVYFYRIQTKGLVQVNKMILIK